MILLLDRDDGEDFSDADDFRFCCAGSDNHGEVGGGGGGYLARIDDHDTVLSASSLSRFSSSSSSSIDPLSVAVDLTEESEEIDLRRAAKSRSSSSPQPALSPSHIEKLFAITTGKKRKSSSSSSTKSARRTTRSTPNDNLNTEEAKYDDE